MKETCKTCKYSNQIAHSGVDSHECRFYAPTPLVIKAGYIGEQDEIIYKFPVIDDDEWCGQFKPKTIK